MEICAFTSKQEIGNAAAAEIKQMSAEAIAARGKFTVAFSGGSLPAIIASGLLSVQDAVDFTKWQVFFCDERYVALDHADSNYNACNSMLFALLPELKQSQIVTIDAQVSLADSASEYERAVRERVTARNGLPSFDLVLCGMGPDGHTCSLFPGHALLQETKLLVAPIADSPKAPPQRITFTYPLLNNARAVFFIAAGASKQDTLAQVVADAVLPAARVAADKVVWFVDVAATAGLPQDAQIQAVTNAQAMVERTSKI
jgi:6-phosphogluconolactonase